ncbi:DALR anticodon-binding domain-containing protein, partial [Candidatus Aenigmatarchaeota archaeon]
LTLKADPKTMAARLSLVKAVQITLKNALGLLSIEAPEKM